MENSEEDLLDIPDHFKRKQGDNAAKWKGVMLSKGPPPHRTSKMVNGVLDKGYEIIVPHPVKKGRKRKSSEQVKCLKRLGWVEWRISELSCEDAFRIISKGEGPPLRKKPGPQKRKREVLIDG